MKTEEKMMRMSKIAIAAVAGLGVLAAAGTAMAQGKKLTEITCEEFLALGEDVQPRIVYWMAGYTENGKPEDVVVETDKFKEPVDAVIEACKAQPKASVYKVVSGYYADADLAP
jgi:acid stress chaperone HdeA